MCKTDSCASKVLDITMSRTRVNKADNFCYISGEETFASQKCCINAMIRKAYHLVPVPHGEDLPIPDALSSVSFVSDEESGEEEAETDDSAGLQSGLKFFIAAFTRPHLITQGECHDLIRELQLPTNKAELLGSRLQQWNFLAADVKI
ncbi:Hypothetical predicted protein [Octopus vulgaris]|uniref:Uncharacterized protein n=1 Tax=Octopus vulgaris TaxID=6645 RepID=A0AA36AM30_OCTVU|nr:Hypothetical predicted protein [Octopus vulgaris]